MTDPLTSTTASPLVIICAMGTGGDIQPFISIALGLMARGHQVLMLLPKFQEEAVKLTGIPYEAFGSLEEGQAVLRNPDLWHERKGWGVIWSGIVPHLGQLAKLMQRLPAARPCVLLSHPILLPMAAIARSVRPDLHIVAAYLAPANLCSSHELLSLGSMRIPSWFPLGWRQALWRMVHKMWIDPTTLPSLNQVRSQHGLPPVTHFFDHMLQTPNTSIGLFPDWFAAPQADWPRPFQVGSFLNGGLKAVTLPKFSAELEQFLAAGDAPIVFTPGTGHQHAANYFAVAVKALARLRRRGIFISSHQAQIPNPLPANILWQAHVPFADLLPKVAAIVHHGGIGTTAEAFLAGIPQLIVPFAYDQFDNALRCKRKSVAEILLAKRLSARKMHQQLDALLSSDLVRHACASMRVVMQHSLCMDDLLDKFESALKLTPQAIQFSQAPAV